MKLLYKIVIFTVLGLIAVPRMALAQSEGSQSYDIDYLTPKEYEIGGITFTGAERLDHRMVMMVAGLQIGDRIKVPGDKLATAIENLWKQGLFEDIKIRVTKIEAG